MDLGTRVDIALGKGWCFKCLSKSHMKPEDCNFTKNGRVCSQCGSPDHTGTLCVPETNGKVGMLSADALGEEVIEGENKWNLEEAQTEGPWFYEICQQTGMVFEREVGADGSRRILHPKAIMGNKKVNMAKSEKLKTGGEEVLVMYDSGSQVSLISSDCVKRQGIKGQPAQGKITAVIGGKEKRELEVTAVHEIPFRKGEYGNLMIVVAYEVSHLDMILPEIDIMAKVAAFEYTLWNFADQGGRIDMVIGADMLGCHPLEWERRGGGVLSRSRLGEKRMLISGIISGTTFDEDRNSVLSETVIVDSDSSTDNVPGFESEEEDGIEVVPVDKVIQDLADRGELSPISDLGEVEESDPDPPKSAPDLPESEELDPGLSESEPESPSIGESDPDPPNSEDSDPNQPSKEQKAAESGKSRTKGRFSGSFKNMMLLNMLLMLVGTAEAFQAFDCSHPNSTTIGYSLLGPDVCGVTSDL